MMRRSEATRDVRASRDARGREECGEKLFRNSGPVRTRSPESTLWRWAVRGAPHGGSFSATSLRRAAVLYSSGAAVLAISRRIFGPRS